MDKGTLMGALCCASTCMMIMPMVCFIVFNGIVNGTSDLEKAEIAFVAKEFPDQYHFLQVNTKLYEAQMFIWVALAVLAPCVVAAVGKSM